MFWPTAAAIVAPIARKVPNGSAVFHRAAAGREQRHADDGAANDPSINVRSVSCQPRNAPIIASILHRPCRALFAAMR